MPRPWESASGATAAETPAGHLQRLSDAFAEQLSDVQVTGEGLVTQLLADDNRGSRHQRFVLTLASDQTVLVAHNIDLAPRLDGLRVGETVAFHGVYEWNPKGGVVHWTHHDPQGRHLDGWLKYGGKVYQ